MAKMRLERGKMGLEGIEEVCFLRRRKHPLNGTLIECRTTCTPEGTTHYLLFSAQKIIADGIFETRPVRKRLFHFWDVATSGHPQPDVVCQSVEDHCVDPLILLLRAFRQGTMRFHPREG